MHNFIDIIREYKIDRPPVFACKMVSSAIVALIIELTAMTKAAFTLDYDTLAEWVKFTKSKKNK